MSYSYSLILFLKLYLMSSSEGALYGNLAIYCQSSTDGHNAVYLEQFYFNKRLEAQYNSTLGKMVGYTKKAKEVADMLNNMPKFITHEIWKANVCKRNLQLAYGTFVKPVEPSIWLRSAEAVDSKHPRKLICSMYDFYPKLIKVTWLRDGKEVKSDVTSTEELSNGNWLFQLHSYLEFTPKPGEKIACMVEHASLRRPKIYEWGNSVSFMGKLVKGT